jgi:uncharacterized protein (DUF924 family)
VTATAEGTRDILDFWFDEARPERWWAPKSAALDEAIRARFERLWTEWCGREADRFLGTADKALAAVLLFDQFPRAMFRGEARAFATDPLALEVARGAIDRGLDNGLSVDERSFLYLPFMHAEDMAAQQQCVALYEELGMTENLRFARLHRNVIAAHGRFPARNAVLGRPTRPEEAATIDATSGW